jgi:hypothetical protein
VEIGAGAAFLGMVDMRGLRDFGPEVHVTVPFTARFALDVSTTLGGQAMPPYSIPGALVEGGARHRTEGLYAAIHQRFTSNTWSGFHAFVSYGLAGLFGATTQAKTRVTFSNGTIHRIGKSRSSEPRASSSSVFLRSWLNVLR